MLGNMIYYIFSWAAAPKLSKLQKQLKEEKSGISKPSFLYTFLYTDKIKITVCRDPYCDLEWHFFQSQQRL